MTSGLAGLVGRGAQITVRFASRLQVGEKATSSSSFNFRSSPPHHSPRVALQPSPVAFRHARPRTPPLRRFSYLVPTAVTSSLPFISILILDRLSPSPMLLRRLPLLPRSPKSTLLTLRTYTMKRSASPVPSTSASPVKKPRKSAATATATAPTVKLEDEVAGKGEWKNWPAPRDQMEEAKKWIKEW